MLLIAVAIFSFSNYANATLLTVSCDNENEDIAAGSLYLSVDGKIDLTKHIASDLKLSIMKSSTIKDEVVAVIPAAHFTATPVSGSQINYSFYGMNGVTTYTVTVSVFKNQARGVSYQISVNNQKLKWCTPAL